jgi:hypothetical protein
MRRTPHGCQHNTQLLSIAFSIVSDSNVVNKGRAKITAKLPSSGARNSQNLSSIPPCPTPRAPWPRALTGLTIGWSPERGPSPPPERLLCCSPAGCSAGQHILITNGIPTGRFRTCLTTRTFTAAACQRSDLTTQPIGSSGPLNFLLTQARLHLTVLSLTGFVTRRGLRGDSLSPCYQRLDGD